MIIDDPAIASKDILTLTPEQNEGIKMHEVQKKSSEEIKKDLENVTHTLLQQNLLYLQHAEPNVQRLMAIPELQDLTLQSMDLPMHSTECKLHSSTAFAWDLRKLLMEHGFASNHIVIRNNGVQISLYNARFNIYIRQPNLAA